MANCGSSMHLCSLRLGQRDRMMLLRHDQQQTGSLGRSLHSLHCTFTHSQPKNWHITVCPQEQEVSLWNKTCLQLTPNVRLTGSERNACKMAKATFLFFSPNDRAKETKTCTTTTEEQPEFSETCRTLCNSSLSVGEKKGSSVLPQKYFQLQSVKTAKITLYQVHSRWE